MWSFLVPFFTETPEAPLILPDSVQKANLAEAVNKIIHLDVGDMLRSLLSESVWILVKILIALAIYFIGRWIVRRIVRQRTDAGRAAAHTSSAGGDRRTVELGLDRFRSGLPGCRGRCVERLRDDPRGAGRCIEQQYVHRGGQPFSVISSS